MDVEDLKRPLRALRGWPPLNIPITSAFRTGVRRLGRPPGRLARYLPRVGLIDTPLPDGTQLRMWSLADDEITSAVYWNGWNGHEPETASLFYDRARTARTTLDIGAHVGYFGLLAAHANPNGTVYAFEPHPLVYERLSRNVSLNHLPNMLCIPVAVGSETGEADFFHIEGSGIPSSSSLSREFMESISKPARVVSSKVEVVSVDSFLEQRGVTGVDLVKMDTEATEDTVIQGMTRTLERDHPTLFCEILDETAAEAVESLLEPFGYRFYLSSDNGLVQSRHITPHPSWRNYCFIAGSDTA